MIEKFQAQRAPVVQQTERVTDLGDETSPDAVGLQQNNIDAVWQSITECYLSGAFPGISICVRKQGEMVLNRAIGFARGGGPGEAGYAQHGQDGLMRLDTPVCLFSASKAITAVLMFKLIEQGHAQLNDRVVEHLPEFAAHGKDEVTIADVLCHRSSVPWYQLPDGAPPESVGNWDEVIRNICAMRPQFKRGVQAYHALTGGFILGEIIQRATGLSVNDYLKTHIAEPMGMRYFTYGLEESARSQVARNYAAGDPVLWPVSRFIERALSVPFYQAIELSNSTVFMDACLPAGNLYATAEELSRFYQMLLNNGEYQGQHILQQQTVQHMTQPAHRLSFDRTLMMPMRYSHGFMLGTNPAGIYGIKTAKAFGHVGFMNIFGWADPQRDLSVGLLVTGKALLGSHLLQIGKFLGVISTQMR